MVKGVLARVRSRWALYLALACVVGLALFVTSNLYPAAWLRWGLGFGPRPVVHAGGVEARKVFEQPRCWVFYARGGGELEELTYEPGEPIGVLPTSPEDAVEIYCNEAFSGLRFPTEEWDALPEGGHLRMARWEEGEWEYGRSWSLGRLPAGPPDVRGYQLTWGCPREWEGKDVPGHWGETGFVIRLTVDAELDPATEMRTTIVSCSPTWDTDHPGWTVTYVERVTACDNRPGLKMMYVTVLDERGEPLQGVKVRFDTEPSYGIVYDHRLVWGLTDRFSRADWDHLGKPTRYWLWMGDDLEPLVVNIRTDLGNEYCKPPGSPWWSGNRPVNRPGVYSYRIEIQRKGDTVRP